ncbi:hypothetical protein [Nocardioides sp. TF02-7]|uniref:hypothetical protein n=1 Tax=Nocardioides sp. TF02-7 TaxID=2917724 RepID=UPI001F054C54|nr:hypothetical protein [Nocardioides sp. TF02-7]UMG93939.1 hypothetical protein MF408_07495 [Nocardioides sp. TF02-7]
MTSPHPQPDPLRAALRERLTRARLDRDRAVTAALRSALAALENAEAVPVADRPLVAGSAHVAGAVGPGAAEADRRELDAAEEQAILRDEVVALRAAAEEYDAVGRADDAAEARRAADALESAAGL